MRDIDVLRIMKQEWGPNQYARRTYARDAERDQVSPDAFEAKSFCALGMIARTAPDTIYTDDGNFYIVGIGAKAVEVLAAKLQEQNPDLLVEYPNVGYEPLIISVNDSRDGYERIMKAVDAILVEEAPAAVSGLKVDERELTPA